MSLASVTNTFSAGEVSVAADVNQNFTDLVNAINAIDDDNVSAGADIDPSKIDDHSTNAAQAQIQTDPYPADALSVATSLEEELEQLRYQIKEIIGRTYWYQDARNAGFSTGDVKLTIKTAADDGWVIMDDGTIGNAASGASTRANADTSALFTLLWDNTTDANCAVSTGRGASAAADYAANKTIALPKALGRALANYDTGGAGTATDATAHAMAEVAGTEGHTLTTAEMPAHTHTVAMGNNTGDGTIPLDSDDSAAPNSPATSSSTGGGGSHENRQTTLYLNVMIKL
jgi:hypothetical protein